MCSHSSLPSALENIFKGQVSGFQSLGSMWQYHLLVLLGRAARFFHLSVLESGNYGDWLLDI